MSEEVKVLMGGGGGGGGERGDRGWVCEQVSWKTVL